MGAIRSTVIFSIFASFAFILAAIPVEATLTKVEVNSIVWSPVNPQPGNIVSFTVTITNTHSSDIKIKWIGIHMDWDKAGKYTYEDISSNPKTLPNGQRYSVTLLLTTPPDATYDTHSYFIRVDYEADTSSHSEKSNEYYNLVLVKDVPPKPEEPVYLTLPVLILMAVIVIVVIIAVFIIVNKRAKTSEVKKRKEYRSALSSGEVAADVELAKTIGKKRDRPMSSGAMKEKMHQQNKMADKEWQPSNDTDKAEDGQILQKTTTRPLPPPTPLHKTLGIGGYHQPASKPAPLPQVQSPPSQQPPAPPSQPSPMPTTPPQPQSPSRPMAPQPHSPPRPMPMTPPQPQSRPSPMPMPPPQPQSGPSQTPMTPSPQTPWPRPPPPPPPARTQQSAPPSHLPPPLPPQQQMITSQCPICGTIIKTRDENCPKCGSSL